MRAKLNIVLALVAVLVTLVALPVQAAEDYWRALRSLPFPENYPTKESADRLYDEVLFQRASQVVIWSLPATALWAMKKGSEAQFGEGSNVFPIWKDRLSAETIVSTPNSDVIYGMGYLDLQKDGPTVIEVPPKLQGILALQRYLWFFDKF